MILELFDEIIKRYKLKYSKINKNIYPMVEIRLCNFNILPDALSVKMDYCFILSNKNKSFLEPLFSGNLRIEKNIKTDITSYLFGKIKNDFNRDLLKEDEFDEFKQKIITEYEKTNINQRTKEFVTIIENPKKALKENLQYVHFSEKEKKFYIDFGFKYEIVDVNSKNKTYSYSIPHVIKIKIKENKNGIEIDDILYNEYNCDETNIKDASILELFLDKESVIELFKKNLILRTIFNKNYYRNI